MPRIEYYEVMKISIFGSNNIEIKYAATVAAFSVSFWSSGVFFIRALHNYELWSSPVFLLAFFAFSIPLVAISIQGVRRIVSPVTNRGEAVVYQTLQCVLLMHSVALGFFPSLYSFIPSGEISATAWLLWFGGIALALQLKGKKSDVAHV